MKNFSTWILLMFMVMFWVFRVIVALTAQLKMDFGGIEPLNMQMEVILLFVVLLCIVLVVKRKLIGALIYLLAYGMYFGTTVVNGITVMLNGEFVVFDVSTYMNTFIGIIGIALPLAILIDMLVDKGRKANPKDKKTDWFYNNKEYDRKLDERADKNNYRTL